MRLTSSVLEVSFKLGCYSSAVSFKSLLKCDATYQQYTLSLSQDEVQSAMSFKTSPLRGATLLLCPSGSFGVRFNLQCSLPLRGVTCLLCPLRRLLNCDTTHQQYSLRLLLRDATQPVLFRIRFNRSHVEVSPFFRDATRLRCSLGSLDKACDSSAHSL